jgi:Na+/proline symporter
MDSPLSVADLAIIVASLALVFLVGVFGGRRRSDTVRGYFLAENKMPWC